MRRTRLLALGGAMILLCAFLAFQAYMGERQPVRAEDIAFVIETGQDPVGIKLWHNYYDGKEYLFLPSFCGSQEMAQVETGRRGDFVWDGTVTKWATLEDGEHSLEVRGTVFTVAVMHSARVPALFLTTRSGSLSYIEEKKGNGEPGLYCMVEEDGQVLGQGEIKKLKSRGNVTFLEDKKPYQMTLTEAADLLGSGGHTKYILLANRQDQSLLRDKIMYDLAADMGLAYSPASRFVDLYVNGTYRGSYQVSEKVEVGDGRIPIETGGSQAETGFLVTLEYGKEDRLGEADYYFTTDNGQNVVIKRPKAPTPAQESYIRDEFQEAESGIRKGELDEERLDVVSFARKYLVEEIGKNLDAMYASQYFYKDAAGRGDGKLYAGPVWDYDKTLGNPLIEHTRPVNFQEPWGIYAAMEQKDASWWYDLYQIPAFRDEVERQYRERAISAVRGMLDEKIDSYRDEIWESARMDYMRWDPFEDFKYGETLEFEQEYQAEVDNIKEFLVHRMEFLDAVWLEGKKYDRIECHPGQGTMYVRELDAVEGMQIHEPRDPKWEGYRFDHWVREDTGEIYDFTQIYDGVPFALRAVYRKEE